MDYTFFAKHGGSLHPSTPIIYVPGAKGRQSLIDKNRKPKGISLTSYVMGVSGVSRDAAAKALKAFGQSGSRTKKNHNR